MNQNKKLTPTEVANSLFVGNPEQTKSHTAQTPALPSGYAMSVSVNDIDFFEGNPRHFHDAEFYNQIKESIRSRGIQQPVHITKRPGQENYVLAQGGNTRLKIAKELWAETGDSKFAQIPCIYIEYTNDENILIAHLIENEQRADMSFWDKACAYTQKSIDLRKQFNDLKQVAKDADADNEAIFDDFWNETLRSWAAAHTGEADLDSAALQQYIAEQFAETFEIGPADDTDSGAETDTPALPRQAPKSVDMQQPEQSGNAATFSDGLKSAGDSDTAAPSASQSDSVARQPVDPAAGAVMPKPTAPPEQLLPGQSDNTAKTREQIQAELISAVKRLLAVVHLEKLLIIDHHMPYGYLLDVPNFSQNPWKAYFKPEITSAYINSMHPFAGAVFHYLWMVSSADDVLLGQIELPDGYNPFTSQPRETTLQNIWANRGNPSYYNQVFDQTLNFDLYRDSGHLPLFELITSNEEALSAYTDFLRRCSELEANGGDNFTFYENNN